MASVPLPRLPRRRLNIWLFGTLLLCFVFFLPRPGDWNQDARLDTIFAIVNHRTVAVDEYRWNAPLDVVRYGGHYYASKAPGQALIGVPIFALYKGALTLSGHQADTARIGLASSWKQLYANFYVVQILETIYTVAIPAAIFLMLFFWFLGYFTESLANRLILTLALGLATDYVG